MPQPVIGRVFLSALRSQGPRGVLDNSIRAENERRRALIEQKGSLPLHAGLVDIFSQGAVDQLVAHPRTDNSNTSHVFPLSKDARRPAGAPATCGSYETFRQRFAIFSEGSLSAFRDDDWANVLVAGGSVLAPLLPLPKALGEDPTRRQIRKHFHNVAFPASDLDLFIYGLDETAALAKMDTIYQRVVEAIPWDVTVVRTKHACTIISQYPYRSIQIILRLYQSPSEILTGFDVDCCTFGFDGKTVWSTERGLVALLTQCNRADITRRSPSYEMRLAKYAARGFEIEVIGLKREDVDPTIYERAIARVPGLARLLVLEATTNLDERTSFLGMRREQRQRPELGWRAQQRFRKRKYKGDLKSESEMAVNDYDTLHLPYGPGWDARRIERHVYRTDLGLNSPFAKGNKGRKIHRHPAFYGTMLEACADCCRYCPEPQTDEDRELQKLEDERYIRGPITWVTENPGAQDVATGSFAPITEGDWIEGAYLQPVDKLFNAVAARQPDELKAVLADSRDVTELLSKRDQVGRSALHLACFQRDTVIATILVEAGARITGRLVDGRSALHLACLAGDVALVDVMLKRSAENEATAAKAKEEAAAKAAEDKTEGDDAEWTHVTGAGETVELPGEEPVADDVGPDVIDLSIADWDVGFTPLQYAIVSGSVETVGSLLEAGANAKQSTCPANIDGGRHTTMWYPLTTLTLAPETADIPALAKKLTAAGATSTQSDVQQTLIPLLHRIVLTGRVDVFRAVVKTDPKSKTALAHLASLGSNYFSPLTIALSKRLDAMTAALLMAGAPTHITKADFDRSIHASGLTGSWQANQWPSNVQLPAEMALSVVSPALRSLIAFGAPVDSGISKGRYGDTTRYSLVEFVQLAIDNLEEKLAETTAKATSTTAKAIGTDASWKERFLAHRKHDIGFVQKPDEDALRVVRYFRKIYEDQLKALTATPGADTVVEVEAGSTAARGGYRRLGGPSRKIGTDDDKPKPLRYSQSCLDYQKKPTGTRNVPDYQCEAYEQLFDAAYRGDTARVQALVASGDQPLQITTKVHDTDSDYGYSGQNPMVVAILAGHFDTAAAILSLAQAQYEPPGEEEEATLKTLGALDSDGEQDDGSDEDYDDEDDSEAGEGGDLDDRLTSAKFPIPASQLFDTYFRQPELGEDVSGDIFGYAIRKGDVELLKELDKLALTTGSDLLGESRTALTTALSIDNVEMVALIIRKTGQGLDVAVPAEKASEEDLEAAALKPDRYAGLDVHGKKHAAALSEQRQPYDNGMTGRLCTVLEYAIDADAVKVIKWLASSDNVVPVYRDWIQAHPNSEEAQRMAKRDLIGEYDQLIGAKPADNTIDRAPLVRALRAFTTYEQATKGLETLKTLLKSFPQYAKAYLHDRVYESDTHVSVHRVTNMPVMPSGGWEVPVLNVAVERNAPIEMIRFLLEQGCNPLATQDDGTNMLHLAVVNAVPRDETTQPVGDLQSILDVLKPEVRDDLLSRRGGPAYLTPLAMAVTKGITSSVEKLLAYPAVVATATLRDQQGRMPLHDAVARGYSVVARLLARAEPSVLDIESATGETPLETARTQVLNRAYLRLARLSTGRMIASGSGEKVEVDVGGRFGQSAVDVKPNEEDVRALEALVVDGEAMSALSEDRQAALRAYAETRRSDFEATTTTGESTSVKSKTTNDREDAQATLAVIEEAYKSGQRRQLVHVSEVQAVMKSTLERARAQVKKNKAATEEYQRNEL